MSGHSPSILFNPDGHFSLRIGPARDGIDPEHEHLALRIGHRCNGAIHGIYRTIAGPGMCHRMAIDPEFDRGGRNLVRPAFDLE